MRSSFTLVMDTCDSVGGVFVDGLISVYPGSSIGSSVAPALDNTRSPASISASMTPSVAVVLASNVIQKDCVSGIDINGWCGEKVMVAGRLASYAPITLSLGSSIPSRSVSWITYELYTCVGDAVLLNWMVMFTMAPWKKPKTFSKTLTR